MQDVWILVRAAVNSLCPMALLFSMVEFKCKPRTAWGAFGGLSLFAVAANVGLYYLLGREAMMQLFAVVVAVPSLAALLLLTRDRLSQLLFSFFTAVNALYLASILGRLVTGMSEAPWLEALTRALFYGALICVFRRWLNKPYHFVAQNLRAGWRIIAPIPFLFFCMVMFLGLYPTVRTDNFPAVILLYGVLVLVYLVIYRVFRSTYELLMQRQEQQRLELQLAAQKQYYEAQLESQQAMRRLRHDFRTHVRVLSGLLAQQKNREAAEYLQQVSHYTDELDAAPWCSDPYLNAVLSSYAARFRQAQAAFECRLQIGSVQLPHVELCLILNNALENALEASLALPAAQRQVSVQMQVRQSQLLLRVRNRCGKVALEGEWPASTKPGPGHGCGLPTIGAAARRLQGAAVCEVKDGWFTLDVTAGLPLSGPASPPARSSPTF
ncbi:sensor histidine kinase [Allofournierella sp.]|uniref:sensor histidine kinase n=1 Tax=Allofournierella sp. TaxID=1940256 RepID=UPI003AB1741A